MTAYPIELGGARWATDGACMVREGVELPAQYTDPRGRAWPWLQQLPPEAITLFAQGALDAPRGGRCKAETVHERFGALLRTADHIDAVTVPHGRDERRIVRCWREGQIVALVARMYGGCRIDALIALESAP